MPAKSELDTVLAMLPDPTHADLRILMDIKALRAASVLLRGHGGAKKTLLRAA